MLVGENDHYKPLAVTLRRMLADGVIGEMVFAHFMTIARRLKTADDWRNDEAMAGGDAFFEEGIHWLHLAGSLGPAIVPESIHGFRPAACPRRRRRRPARQEHDGRVPLRQRRGRVAVLLARDSVAAGRGSGCRSSSGAKGVITFESNGLFVASRGKGFPRLVHPGFRDMRGYQAMYRDFLAAIRGGRRARDEPRAGDGRSAADGPRLRHPRNVNQHFDIVIIGSGAGGGTIGARAGADRRAAS